MLRLEALLGAVPFLEPLRPDELYRATRHWKIVELAPGEKRPLAASVPECAVVLSGKVLVDESVDLETVATADRRDRWSFESDVNGICTEVKDLAFKVHYESGAKGMSSVIVCDEEPKVRVHGSAFGVLPTWAIDVVIPGNMEELTRSFFHVVTRGNGGKGMVIRADTRVSANSGVSVFDLDGEAEGLNNFLVRLGFKLARKKLIPPDDAIDDLAHYLRDGHAALTKDIEEFAAGVK